MKVILYFVVYVLFVLSCYLFDRDFEPILNLLNVFGAMVIANKYIGYKEKIFKDAFKDALRKVKESWNAQDEKFKNGPIKNGNSTTYDTGCVLRKDLKEIFESLENYLK